MVKILFYLAVVALIIYSAILIITPLYHYYAFKSDLEETIDVSISEKPEDLLTRVYELARQYNIPVEKDDIKLWQDKQYFAAVSWKETVDFFTIYQKTFIFSIDTSKQSSWKVVHKNLQFEFS